MKITIVDDEKDILTSLSRFLRGQGHQTFCYDRARQALDTLALNGSELVLADVNMPDMDGYELLRSIRAEEKLSEVNVVLFTGYAGVKGAVKAIREGAYDYLVKPIDLNELLAIVNRICEYKRLKLEHESLVRDFQNRVESSTREIKQRYQKLQESLASQYGLGEIGVFSPAMSQVLEIAARFHEDPAIPVLIEGETGTGKEVVAKFIHYGPEMIPAPFVDINCAAISPNLFESELFGYVKGAFTGARAEGDPGKIAVAENGTLFLDEIGELTPDQQAKLLRLIQERQYYRVGGTTKLHTNTRFVCATNRPVLSGGEGGDFRRDFYYRLQVGHLRIPPLRERREEIVPLALFFLERFRRNGNTRFADVTPEARALLEAHDWPGNVRELRNTIERIVTLFHGERIDEGLLSRVMLPMSSVGEAGPGCTLALNLLPADAFSLDEAILNTVARALTMHNGNKSETARYLGIPRNRLYHYLQKWESESP